MSVNRDNEIYAVERFLSEPKRLAGSPPFWNAGRFANEYHANWGIEDFNGAVVGELRARALMSDRSIGGIAVIHRSRLVWRADVDPPTRAHDNPPNGHLYGLPARVIGPHSHGWRDNVDHLRSQEVWDLPFRRPLPPQVRRIEQVLLWLAEAVNLKLEYDQRGFGEPRQQDLFELGAP